METNQEKPLQFIGESSICPGEYVIADGKQNLVLAKFFHRSKTAVSAMACSAMSSQGKYLAVKSQESYRRHTFYTTDEEGYGAFYKTLFWGRDRATVCTLYSLAIGKQYVFTTENEVIKDFYQFLMKTYELPLLEDWTSYLYNECLVRSYLSEEMNLLCETKEDSAIELHGTRILCKDLKMLTVKMTEQELEELVSDGLRSRKIWISTEQMQPLSLEKGLDGYLADYGKYVQQNVDKSISPLVPLKDKVDGFVTKKIRPYPQQAAIINGIIALKEQGSKYAFLNAGMGCGKSAMSIGVVEGYENTKWLLQHPGKSLKEMYLSEEQPVYRTIIMPPGHLVEKWKREILAEVPGAKVIIINSLNELVKLREKGRKPTAREWYIIGKDFCKLGASYSPIPVNIVKDYLYADYCRDCYEDQGDFLYKVKDAQGRCKCPRCGGRRFKSRAMTEFGKVKGLVCPHCGKLLVSSLNRLTQANPDGIDDKQSLALLPVDFASRTAGNSFCACCSAPLWGVNAKPINNAGLHKPAWYKISHFSNWTFKNRKSAFVLRGHEKEYYYAKEMIDPTTNLPFKELDIQKIKTEYGPRKVAPAAYIKKYLKGYWDFVILDEVHKYAGAGTAQSNAAHALIKTGNFVMGLTGTLTNGKADSLFYLLWMLDPQRMKKAGFLFRKSIEFSKAYGCVETVFQADEDYMGSYNANSRGRMISPPRVKPGISPLVYSEFLLDKALNMDLSDLTKFMPPLHEYVEVVTPPDDVKSAYNSVVNILKGNMKTKEGADLRGELLQFCLSYPDKPYGRKPILNPKIRNDTICIPSNLDYYQDEMLPKESRMVAIVNQEMEENRNVFIFANFTGKEETNVTSRVKHVIEKHCNLKGRVEILRADTPEALKREAYIHARAKAGIKVVITNAKVCETGLDFCFEEDGIYYNYPTIIFMQPTYELATMIQASRRHYRLNQREECRTYWMSYADTLQTAALQIMAAKQVAASAIQGKFSADGLANMAKGVDPRLELVKKLSQGDNSSLEELNSMFDVIAKNAEGQNEDCGDYVKPKTFFELMGADYKEDIQTLADAGSDVKGVTFDLFGEDAFFDFVPAQKGIFEENKAEIPETTEVEDTQVGEADSFESFFLFFEQENISAGSIVPSKTGSSKNRKKKTNENQMMLF